MPIKEPKFMQELHRIRAQMAKEWRRMSSEEIEKSLHISSKWLRERTAIIHPKKA